MSSTISVFICANMPPLLLHCKVQRAQSMMHYSSLSGLHNNCLRYATLYYTTLHYTTLGYFKGLYVTITIISQCLSSWYGEMIVMMCAPWPLHWNPSSWITLRYRCKHSLYCIATITHCITFHSIVSHRGRVRSRSMNLYNTSRFTTLWPISAVTLRLIWTKNTFFPYRSPLALGGILWLDANTSACPGLRSMIRSKAGGQRGSLLSR